MINDDSKTHDTNNDNSGKQTLAADSEVSILRQKIIASLQVNRANNTQSDNDALFAKHLKNKQAWWLLGTLGCHLCNEAETLLHRYQAVDPIDYVVLDIADFDDALMAQFATYIPVLITPKQRLNYPFSVMDLQSLSHA